MAAAAEVDHDFALKQLTKHGWSEGKGLGKSEHGIKNAIKVAFKNDKVGLGVDESEQFTFHWWDHVFNKVAQKIQVDGKKEKKSKKKKNKEVSISTNKPNKYEDAKSKYLYGRFVNGGMLKKDDPKVIVAEDAKSDTDSSEDEGTTGNCKSYSQTDTIEKVFEKTGFTAHKAARHGHRLNGKLKRLQQQEEEALAIAAAAKLNKRKKEPEQSNDDVDIMEPKSKKRKKSSKSKDRKKKSITDADGCVE